MDGYTDLPFRLACSRAGAGTCCTEMVPAMALVHGAADARRRLRMADEERPVVAQIVGHDPEPVARAARIAQDLGADVVDINAGCPSRRVTNGGSGAALLSDLPRLARILEATRAAVTVPLTLKVRPGPRADCIVVDEVARIVSDTGVDAVTIHGRTRAQGFGGRADWRHVARLKELVSVPVIGNGDVACAEDGLRMLRETGCDAVMVGRAAIGYPWIFRELEAAWRGLPEPPKPDRAELAATVREHFARMVEHVGDERAAAKVFRKHLARYGKGLPGVVRMRRRLPEVVSAATLDEVLEEVLAS
jgi:nifR3 family TIM-barrel protein